MKSESLKKRIARCFGLSLLTHVGIVLAAFSIPGLAGRSPIDSGAAAATAEAQTTLVAVSEKPAVEDSNELPVTSVAANEVKEARADEQEIVAPNEQKLAPTPEPPKAEKKAAALPEQTKHITALPAKKVSAKKDSNIQNALLISRAAQAEQEQSKPEIAADIPVQDEATQPVTAVASADAQEIQPDATFPDEAKSSDSAEVIPPIQKSSTRSSDDADGQPAPQAAPSAPAVSAPAPSKAVPTAIRNGDDLREQAGNLKPRYPIEDRKAGRQGVVVFVAKVLQDGRVDDIRLEKSSSSPSLDRSAMTAFKTYHYQAGQEGWVRKAFAFSLKGEAKEVSARE